MKKILFGLLALLASANFALAQSPFPQNIKVRSVIAANNTTAIVIKSTPGTIYNIETYNIGTAIAFAKIYNATTATCGTGTPVARYFIPPVPAAVGSFGGLSNITNPNGDAYGLGIVLCITGAIADNDTTAPAASSIIVNIHYE